LRLCKAEVGGGGYSEYPTCRKFAIKTVLLITDFPNYTKATDYIKLNRQPI
jgi:hypothetical protein